MSGIVGILYRDGKLLNSSVMKLFADFLVFRGPERVSVWSDGPVGFGHTLLRTSRTSVDQNGLLASSDEGFCITSDSRLDNVVELEGKLKNVGCSLKDIGGDAALILKAYAVWGTECLAHLRGDFAFAIWDVQRKRLFCARDHFGIKPFYYVALQDLFLFSNTLNCLRLHPRVSEALNHLAIADFLLFGLNCNTSTTTFQDIQRLPPAHFMLVSTNKLEIQRYWSAPVDGCVRYTRAEDYVENFRNTFQLAVDDRLGADRAAILLSGGLDSAAVAATAQQFSARHHPGLNLYAYTNIYKSLPEEDGSCARITATFLDIPIRFLPLDDLNLFERWNDPASSWPEPIDDPLRAGWLDLFRAIAQDCRVALSGEGSDNLMYFQMLPQLKQSLKKRQFANAFADLAHYASIRPFPWRGLRRLAGRIVAVRQQIPCFPEWIEPNFVQRYELKQRWKNCNGLPLISSPHPTLPKAHASLGLPQWTQLFELADPGVTKCPVELRYPFLDLRVVEFLLGIPAFPWAFNKQILRQAMSRHLPDSIRLRRKTPFSADPIFKKLQLELEESFQSDRVTWCADIDQYICRSSVFRSIKRRSAAEADLSLRPLCLNFWLQSKRRVGYKLAVGA